MYKGVIAYLFRDSTVVLNKSDIHNAKDDDFKEVRLLIPIDFIKESYEEYSFVSEDEEKTND